MTQGRGKNYLTIVPTIVYTIITRKFFLPQIILCKRHPWRMKLSQEEKDYF